VVIAIGKQASAYKNQVENRLIDSSLQLQCGPSGSSPNADS
jgi:hypothetical protein